MSPYLDVYKLERGRDSEIYLLDKSERSRPDAWVFFPAPAPCLRWGFAGLLPPRTPTGRWQSGVGSEAGGAGAGAAAGAAGRPSMEEQQPEPKSQRDSGLGAAAVAAAPGSLSLSLSPGASGSSGSDGDSVPVSPQPAPPSPPAAPCLPPLAHHPHLPPHPPPPPPPPPQHLAAPAHQPQPAAQLHRTTNFFIDNILRPDFGCKKEQPPPQLLVAAAAGGGAGGGRVERDRGQTGAGRDPVHPLGTRAPGAASLLCAPDVNCGPPDGSPPAAGGGAGASKAGNPAAAAAAAAVAAAAAAAKPSDSGGGSGGGVGSPSAQGAKYPEHGNPAILLMGSANGGPVVKTDSQQPLVWPAWVYCTRYSDRPSSGEYPTPGCAMSFGPVDAPRTLSRRCAGESRPGLGCSLLSRLLPPDPRPSHSRVCPQSCAPGLCGHHSRGYSSWLGKLESRSFLRC